MADKVLVKGDRSSKFGDYAYKGPYEIEQVNNNGTFKIRKGSVTDVFNIRNIKPYNKKLTTPIMGQYAVYCIQHRYTIIVHRIEMMRILKLFESCLWKMIAYMGITPKGLDSKWKIPF